MKTSIEPRDLAETASVLFQTPLRKCINRLAKIGDYTGEFAIAPVGGPIVRRRLRRAATALQAALLDFETTDLQQCPKSDASMLNVDISIFAGGIKNESGRLRTRVPNRENTNRAIGLHIAVSAVRQ